MQTTVRLGVNAGEQRQRIDVGEQAIEELFSNARLLLFVECEPFQQIGLRRTGDADLHQWDLI